jgi:hypothetical protein
MTTLTTAHQATVETADIDMQVHDATTCPQLKHTSLRLRMEAPACDINIDVGHDFKISKRYFVPLSTARVIDSQKKEYWPGKDLLLCRRTTNGPCFRI